MTRFLSGPGPMRRGRHNDQRRPGAPETHVIWLIAQRSQGSILLPDWCCPPGNHVMQDYPTRSGKARVTAAVRLATFSLP
jgi:hypothetical protein